MIIVEQTSDVELLTKLNKQVQELHYSLYPKVFKAYSFDSMYEMFKWCTSQPNYFHYIAKYNGIPAGYAQADIVLIPDLPFRYSIEILHINHMAVLKEYQHKGIGTALISKIKELAISNQIQRIELDVWSNNTNAKLFYNKLGFSTFSEKMSIEV